MKGIIKIFDTERFKKQFTKSEPFSHVVIDDFFDPVLLKSVSESFPEYDDKKWFRFRKNIGEYENIFESKMSAISKPDMMPSLCRTFLHNLNSSEFCQILENITGIKGIRRDCHWHYTGLRINTPGSKQLIHSDALFHPHLKKRKILTMMIYLTENWKKSDAGELELWNDDMTKCEKKIEPLFNRIALFQNTETSYHGVTKNNHFRKAITMSYLLDENEEKRWRALFVKRPEDMNVEDFDKIAKHRSKLNDTK